MDFMSITQLYKYIVVDKLINRNQDTLLAKLAFWSFELVVYINNSIWCHIPIEVKNK